MEKREGAVAVVAAVVVVVATSVFVEVVASAKIFSSWLS